MAKPLKIFLIAGEPSGDRLGAALMMGLKQERSKVEFLGIGGPLMEAQGLKCLFPMGELSIMGIAEVLPKLPGLLRRVKQAAEAVVDVSPDALVTIDSPDFCLRVARKVKAADAAIRTIHYVAPTVWAWRPERAAKMARHIDHVLALFPFEPPYMEAEGMSCDFVGHPVVSESAVTLAEIRSFRQEIGLSREQQSLVVLPGSRMGEILRILPVFGEVVREVSKSHPNLRLIVPAAANVAAPLADMIGDWPKGTVFLDPHGQEPALAERRKKIAMATGDLALAASGTVSLELASVGTPMVIAYKFNWLTTQIIKRKVRIDTATLVNILTDSHVVPEFLFEECQSDKISSRVRELLDDPEKREHQKEAAVRSMELLGAGGDDPGLRAARSVLGAL